MRELIFFSLRYISRFSNHDVHYRYGIGMSTKKTITIIDFERNLQYFKGLHSIQRFVANRSVSPIVMEVANKVIPQYMMEDAFHFIFQRLDGKAESNLWADALSNAAGYETTIHVLASKLTAYYTDQLQLRESNLYLSKKREKYKRLFFYMCGVALLLVTLLALVVLF